MSENRTLQVTVEGVWSADPADAGYLPEVGETMLLTNDRYEEAPSVRVTGLHWRDDTELGATRLLVDTAFGIGGLSEDYGLFPAKVGDEIVLVFAERTSGGLVPLAEVRPPAREYRDVEEEQ